MYRPLIITVLAACIILTGCAAKREERSIRVGETTDDPVDGGVTKRSDSKAKKTIDSKEITSFSCRFSTTGHDEAGILGDHIYRTNASIEDDILTGRYEICDSVGAEYGFSEKNGEAAQFMNELSELVFRYDIAQYNGHSRNVSGLPDEFGVRMDIDFASGEYISVYDNQDLILPMDFLHELTDLFESCSAKKAEALDISVSKKTDLQVTDPLAGYITYTINTSSGYPELINSLNSINSKNAGYYADYQNDAKITRSDSILLSLYEIRKHENMEFIETHNFLSANGKELYFDDVFKDPDKLPSQILEAFRRSYPDLAIPDEAEEYIRSTVNNEDISFYFALDKDCVHFFADEYVLADTPGILQTSLPYSEYPALVRPLFSK